MSGKTGFITGATSGIGEATARLLAREGYNLILTGRRLERLEKLCAELQSQHGIRCLPLCFDVRNRAQVEECIAGMPASWNEIDVLVNNAGLASGLSQLAEGDIDDWEKMIDTNIKGLLYVSRSVLPLMIARKSGHVVNISSIAGKEVYANGNVYCGTKHAVDALSKGMRIELSSVPIKVTAINPGAVETEFSLVRFHGDAERAKTVYKGFENLVAADIAEAIWFVLSRPAHVNINELTIMPTAQPAAGLIHRKA